MHRDTYRFINNDGNDGGEPVEQQEWKEPMLRVGLFQPLHKCHSSEKFSTRAPYSSLGLHNRRFFRRSCCELYALRASSQ